jgi:hypothetical protein
MRTSILFEQAALFCAPCQSFIAQHKGAQLLTFATTDPDIHDIQFTAPG